MSNTQEFEIDYEEILEALDIIRRKYGDYTALVQRIDDSTRLDREHRKKMSLFLGRDLKRHEYIHHINLNKTDNRIENLIIMERDEHMKAHQSLRSIGEAIALILYERGIVYFDDDKKIYKIRYKKKIFNDLKKGKKIGSELIHFL